MIKTVTYPILYHGAEDYRYYHCSYNFSEYKEFGDTGLYCTTSKIVAESYARYHFSCKFLENPHAKLAPSITRFRYIENETLNMIQFKDCNTDWLNFVLKCLAGQPHDYDIVAGPILNRTIFKEYLKNKWTFDYLLQKLSEDYNLNPRYQVNFCTHDAIKTLKVLDYYTVEP
jgi:hypothetical protein